MSRRGVVVTGVGVVSAAGTGCGALLELLESGASGVRADPALENRPVGRTADPPSAGLARRLDRSARLFLVAAREAWEGAGLPPGGAPADAENPTAHLDPDRCAVFEGSSLGPMADLLAAHATRSRGVPPARGILTFMTGAGGAAFAQERGIRGPVLHVSAGSVSAACAVGEAASRISAGELDLAVAGGAECPLHPDVVATFAAAGILTEAQCRPFDARRSGTVLGEGGAAFVLEAEDHARARGAVALARIVGLGVTTEAYSMVAPDPAGAGVARAVAIALNGSAGRDDAAAIDWIKTHGTGTRANDAAECRGLATVFGDRLAAIPLTSLKPALGHCLGASGAVEMAGCVLAMGAELIPPTLGYEDPDPTLPVCRIARSPERRRADRVLLLSESFGGRCAAMVLARAA